MKNFKEKVKAKWNSIDKEKIKNKLIKIGIGATVGVAGFVGYKLGVNNERFNYSLLLSKVLIDHPELEEPFINALDDTLETLKN